jgi:hypothetical protein
VNNFLDFLCGKADYIILRSQKVTRKELEEMLKDSLKEEKDMSVKLEMPVDVEEVLTKAMIIYSEQTFIEILKKVVFKHDVPSFFAQKICQKLQEIIEREA